MEPNAPKPIVDTNAQHHLDIAQRWSTRKMWHSTLKIVA